MKHANDAKFLEISRKLTMGEFKYPKIEDIKSNIELCVAATRLYEISQCDKLVEGIILVPDEKKYSWVTLGAGAGINVDALIDPCGQTLST